MKAALSVFVVAGAMGFLGWYALQHAAEMPDIAKMNRSAWSGVFIALLWYNVAAIVTAVNWHFLLRSLGDRSELGVPECIYLVTQVAKYVPGNFAHLLGRVALAGARGIAIGTATASLFLEQALAILSAMVLIAISALLMPEVLRSMMPRLPSVPFLAIASLCVALIPLLIGTFAGWAKSWLPGRYQKFFLEIRSLGPLRMIGLVAAYCIPFVILGVSMAMASKAISGTEALTPLAAAVIFSGAWIVGFIMPGAPAGVGVREAIMVLGLAPIVGEGAALSIAIAMRLISVVGDASSFLLGFAGDQLMGRAVRSESQCDISDRH